jgi:hypothetical protein
MNAYASITGGFGMVGAIALGKLGHSCFGWTGAVGGALIGLVVGTFVGILNENWARHRQDMRYRKEQRRVYGEHFGQYWSPDRNDDWDKHVAAYPLGARMDGKFVEIVDGELIIDTGDPFPANLSQWEMHLGYKIRSPLPEIGQTVSAWVLKHDVDGHMIQLSQYAYSFERENIERTGELSFVDDAEEEPKPPESSAPADHEQGQADSTPS